MSGRIREFVVKVIQKKTRLPVECDIDAFNYIDSGHVDSMAIIRFILELESEFKIDIAPEEIESAEFKSIGGLVKIIQSKVENR